MSPRYGLLLLVHRPGVALAILGGVFLAMTGGEALYADMGHFGKRPVRVAWFSMVWPALVLNYFGQGAMILERPAAAHLPLYQLVPARVLPLMVAARDAGHDHCLAGDDHRRVFRHAPVHPARSAAALRITADLGARAQPDLRTGGELVRADRGVPVRARFPHFGRAGRRLWRSGRRNDVHHHAARHAALDLRNGAGGVGGRAAVFGPLMLRRPGLPGRQSDQVHPGRLGAVDAGE